MALFLFLGLYFSLLSFLPLLPACLVAVRGAVCFSSLCSVLLSALLLGALWFWTRDRRWGWLYLEG